MKITAMADTSDLRGRLKEFGRIVGKETSEAVRQFARKACIELATETQPFGNKKEDAAKGETAVARDIYKVYYPATGAKFLKQVTGAMKGYYSAKGKPEYADKFKDRILRYQMAGDMGALAKIAGDIGFTDAQFDGFNPSRHRSSRDNKGRVARGTKAQIIFGGEKELEKYIETTQRKVGLTKAGWAVCAEKIPLNQAQAATRGIPQWVTRNKGRATGYIKDDSANPTNPKVTMANSTPWCSMVLTPQQAQGALDLTRRNFVKYMNTTIKKTLREQAKLAA